MAGQSGKRVAAENRRLLSIYLQLAVVANVVYVTCRLYYFAGVDTNYFGLILALLAVDCLFAFCFWWLRANSASGVGLNTGLGT